MSATKKAAPKKAAPKKSATKRAPAKKSAPKKAAPKKRAKSSLPKILGLEAGLEVRKKHFAHGHTEETDDLLPAGQLLKKAIYSLTQDPNHYPGNISESLRENTQTMTHTQRIDEAIAYLGAERAKLIRLDVSDRARAKVNPGRKAAPKKAAPKKAAKKSAPKKSR